MLGIGTALAVPTGVENERRPSLRLRLVAGLLELLHVQPAQNLGADNACAEEQHPMIAREGEVVGREARADQRELLRMRIVHRDVAIGLGNRECLRGWLTGAGLAEVGVGIAAYLRGHP